MKELSTEARVLLAFVLSIAVMAVWGTFFMPRPVPRPAPAAESQAPGAQPAPTPGAPATALSPSVRAAQPAATTPAAPAPKVAAEEKTIVVENGLFRVEFSNRGGVVRSWQLKKYLDDHKPQRTLDVTHPEVAEQLGTWPLTIALVEMNQPNLESEINSALFQVTPDEPYLTAPREIAFEWSDGRLAVSKRLRFEEGYLVDLDTEVTLEGQPLAHAVAWSGGFGDETVYEAAEQVNVFYRLGGSLATLAHGSLGAPDQRDLRLRQSGTMEYTGIQDRYFAAVFIPRGARPEVRGSGLALWHWKREATRQIEGKPVKVPVAAMAAGSTVPGPLALRLFVGPKDIDVLGDLKPPMPELVDFGWDWLEWLAKPLFYFLKWIYDYVPNYGWAIIVMTIVINIILFPLKVKSWRSMQKMQKVMPEIRSIQDRYKKYSMRDPKKQEMQTEVMAVYKREGVNPIGGCLPMALQMPIWFALYQMLYAAIELRHAPWIWWIRDLAAPDPYRILPILMAVTMWLMQKMTPVTSPDPAQQRMMTMMPIIFGGMFIIIPISSGLILYILASNLVGMLQQWYLNRTTPPELAAATAGKRKKKK